MKITSIGELLIDFTPAEQSAAGNPLYEMNSGGACANVAAAAAKLGADTAFAGKVGRDAFGDFLIERLKECGVNITYTVRDDKNPTTLAFVHLADDGDRSFSFVRNPGAETCLTGEDIPDGMLENTDILHFGSIPLTNEPSRSTIMQTAKKAYDAGKIVSFDPNLRRLLWRDLSKAREVMLGCLKFCHILKVSEEELEFLAGITSIEQAAEQIYKIYHVPIILATLGKDGVYCQCGSETHRLSSYSDAKTVDTTGAGDCFIGAFLRCVSKYGFEAVCGEKLIDSLRFANTAAGLSTAKKGAIPSIPDEEMVKTAVAEQKYQR